MMLRWRLREQVLDGAMRANGKVEENAVTMAAGISPRRGGAVDDATTGGRTATEVRGEEASYYLIAINIIAN